MQYIEKNEKSERVYSVKCDQEGLRELLNQIVRNASYRKQGRFHITDDDHSNGIDGYKLPNGDAQYENIKNVFQTTTGSIDHSIGVEGTKVIAPELAKIVRGIIDGDEGSIEQFVNYPSSQELVPINEKIMVANQQLNSQSHDYSWKLAILSNLGDLFEARDKGYFFDTDLLKQFYGVASSLVEMKLVSEQITIGDKILLKEYNS